jgi:hypothetical protein
LTGDVVDGRLAADTLPHLSTAWSMLKLAARWRGGKARANTASVRKIMALLLGRDDSGFLWGHASW